MRANFSDESGSLRRISIPSLLSRYHFGPDLTLLTLLRSSFMPNLLGGGFSGYSARATSSKSLLSAASDAGETNLYEF